MAGNFKYWAIHLKGPICTCPAQNLKFSAGFSHMTGKFKFEITCKTCNAVEELSSDDYPVFKLDKPYPKSILTRRVNEIKTVGGLLEPRDNNKSKEFKITDNDRRFLRNLRIAPESKADD